MSILLTASESASAGSMIPLILMYVVVFGVFFYFVLYRPQKKEQKKEAVKKLIASENYKIDVRTAMPMRGRSIPLTSPYSLEIRNDSVISYLPYFGRAYSIPYGGGDGLDFKAPLKEYDMKMDKKGNAVIEFVARNPEDRYEFRAKVYTNGEASINVNMQNRQSISFQGELEMED